MDTKIQVYPGAWVGGETENPPADSLVMPSDGADKHFAETCEYCDISLKMPLDKSNRGTRNHRTCGLAIEKLRGGNEETKAFRRCAECGNETFYISGVAISRTAICCRCRETICFSEGTVFMLT